VGFLEAVDVCFVYITASSSEEARNIGRLLVEKRLAACINIYPVIESIYRWEGGLVEEQETVFIAKTRMDLVEPLKEAVLSVHSYKTPCIVTLALEKGYAPYLDWIRSETIHE